MKNRRDVTGMTEYGLEVPPTPHFPGRILREYPLIQRPGRASKTRSTDQELLDLVTKKFAMDGNAPSMDDAFFFPAEISNQSLDSYFTKMAESSLRNYAADCQAGVAFQNSHQNYNLGVGYVIDGEYISAGDQQNSQGRVLADIYTVRGLKLNSEIGTDDFIRGVQAGLIRDVSIGFKPGEGYAETCNICRQEYWSWDCGHCAGVTYEVSDDPNADPTNDDANEILCYVWIENARLSEVSAVYDGATPDSMILSKAMREMRAGRMTASIRTQIERRFHIDLRDPQKTFGGFKSKTEQERHIHSEEENSNTMKTELELAQERATKAETDRDGFKTERDTFKIEADKVAGLTERAEKAEKANTDLATAIRAEAAEVEGIEIKDDTSIEDIFRAMSARVKSLAPRAEEAEGFRQTAIDDALKAKIRAYGDGVDEAKTRAFLDKLSLEEIAEQGKEWEARAVASGKFPAKRVSGEDGGDPPAEGEGGEPEGEGAETGTADRSANAHIPMGAFGAL